MILEALIRQGESETLEFKESTAEITKGFKTLCAFLNTRGGAVLFGINDKGVILGQDVSNNTLDKINQEINKIEPSTPIDITYQKISNKKKQVIMLSVPAGEHIPYTYDGKPYYRLQKSTLIMPQEKYKKLLLKQGYAFLAWEAELTDYSLQKIDTERVLAEIEQGVGNKRLSASLLQNSVSKILSSIHLMKDNKLTNAALVLFGKDLFPDYPQCELKVARFKGINRREFMDIDLYKGNTFDLIEKGLEFAKKHLPVAAKIIPGQLKRTETPLVPYDAIREALCNAVCHRDYSARGANIGLAIYDDRMEIFNNGGLVDDLTIEMIKEGGHSRHRNPLIAEVFYRTKNIEKWGRGIREIMIDQCLENGDPEPEIIANTVEFKVIFKFPHSLKPPEYTVKQPSPLNTLTNRQQAIIDILRKSGPLQTTAIERQLKETISTRTLRRELAKMKDQGLIEARGRGPNATWSLLNY